MRRSAVCATPSSGEGAELEPWPVSRDDHERLVGQPVEHHLKKLHRGGVGPVEVLDDQYEGALLSRRSVRRRIARKSWRFSCSGSTWRKRSAVSMPRT